jgi:hypothetical protein
MHPQVQLSVRDWLAEAEEDGRVAEQAVQLLAERFPNGDYSVSGSGFLHPPSDLVL